MFMSIKKKNYYKPESVNKIWSNNNTNYERNGDRNKTLSVEEYLDKARPYLKDITNNLKKSHTWTVTNNSN